MSEYCWISQIARPAPMACTVPAGMKKASPALTGIQFSNFSISPLIADFVNCSGVIVSRNPMASCAPGSARRMYHISVFPREFSCSAANTSSGCTCTESAPLVKTNLISNGRSASNQISPIFWPELGNQGARFSAPQIFSSHLVGRRIGPLFTDKALDAIEPAFQLSHRGGVGDSYVLIRSECLAGNHCDMRTGKQALGKLQRRLVAFAEHHRDVR